MIKKKKIKKIQQCFQLFWLKIKLKVKSFDSCSHNNDNNNPENKT